VGEAVAALDAHVVGDGAEAVRGVEVAVGAGVFCAAPEAFASVREEFVAKVVEVGAFAIENVAEFACVDHAEDERLVVAVAAVLEHEAVLAGFFGAADDAPAVFEGDDGWNFDSDIFAVSHGGERHRSVPAPGSGSDDEVDVIASHEGFIMLRAVGEEFGALLSGGGDEARGVVGFVFDDVADGDDLPVGGEEIAKERCSAAAYADETDAGLAFLEGYVGHGFAVGGEGRFLRESLLDCSGYGCSGEASLHEAATRPSREVFVVDCHL